MLVKQVNDLPRSIRKAFYRFPHKCQILPLLRGQRFAQLICPVPFVIRNLVFRQIGSGL